MDFGINLTQLGRWLTDILIQFMLSPSWVVPIQDFIDQHCESFTDTEENKLIYSEVHTNFSEMIEQMLENLSTEVGVSEGVLVGVLDEALKKKELVSYFEYVLATVDFLVFKRIMIKRNIEIEIEIRKRMNVERSRKKNRQEEEDLQLALRLSMICQEQYEAERIERRLKEDEELRKVIEMSSSQYIEDVQREKFKILQEIEAAQEELRKRQVRGSEEEVKVKKDLEKVKKSLEELKIKADEEKKKQKMQLGNVEQLQEMKKKIELERERLNKVRKEEEALLIQKKIERKSVEDKISRNSIEKSSVSYEEPPSIDLDSPDLGESLESRQERLKLQRDLVLRKMKDDRRAALLEHLSQGGVDFTYKPEEVSRKELAKRKKILGKLKEGNNLPFNN